LLIGSFGCLEWWRGAVSHDPDEVSRTFKKHCTRCDAWNRVTVHRLPTDGDWDEAHPYFFRSRKIEISFVCCSALLASKFGG